MTSASAVRGWDAVHLTRGMWGRAGPARLVVSGSIVH